MGYAPKTSSEINLHRVERMVKKVKTTNLTVSEGEELERRFNRLKKDNEGMYIDLRHQYDSINQAKSMSY